MNHASEGKHVLKVIKGLVRGNQICVLSTIAGDRPYCSLMRYSFNDECTEIYLVTHRNTTKYRNLLVNPQVSLLMDTRERGIISEVQALTIEGRYVPIDSKATQNDVCKRFIDQHPDLETFLNHPDAELMRIEIHSFLLLNGLQEAHHIRIKS